MEYVRTRFRKLVFCLVLFSGIVMLAIYQNKISMDRYYGLFKSTASNPRYVLDKLTTVTDYSKIPSTSKVTTSARLYTRKPITHRGRSTPKSTNIVIEEFFKNTVTAVRDHFRKLTSTMEKIISPRRDEFRLRMTLPQKQMELVTLILFMKMCEMANATCFLAYGTLVGSYRHHGFVPWDCDLDVFIDKPNFPTLQRLVSSYPGAHMYGFHTMHRFHVKHFLHAKGVGNPIWPCVDVFSFKENSSHVIDPYASPKRSDVFPLRLRPFENMWFPVPCNPRAILDELYNISTCATGGYNHVTGRGSPVKHTPCEDLYGAFPFVFRKPPRNNSSVQEILKVGEKVIQTLSIPSTCTASEGNRRLKIMPVKIKHT